MKTSKQPRKNVWKVVSLIFIAIFCITVIGGVMKFYHISSSLKDATPEQIQMAETLVAADLQTRGIDISAYHLDIDPKVRMREINGQKRALIHASLTNANIQESYLIDLDSGKIVMHSATAFYDWMADSSNRKMTGRAWFHGKR